MVTITLPDALAERLAQTAQTNAQSIEDLVTELLDSYGSESVSQHRFDHIIGLFDDDISDMSSTVRETMQNHFASK